MRCFNRRKYQKKTSQMSINFGEIVKKLIPVFGEKPGRGLPKPSPPSCTAPGFGDSHTWKNTKLSRQAPNPAAQMRRRSEITHQWSNISRCFFHTKMCIPFLLLIAVANCAHLLSMCLAGENGALYSEGRANKRAPNLVVIPQLTALHPTGNISAEDSVHKSATTAHVE